MAPLVELALTELLAAKLIDCEMTGCLLQELFGGRNGERSPAPRRMPKRARLVGLLAVVTGIACSKGLTPMDESHHAQVVQAIGQRMRSFEAAERALDAETLVGHFATGPDFYIYNDGQRLTYEIMTKAVRGTFPTLRSITGGFIDLHVMALAPDVALATARFQETVTDRTGSQTIQHGAVSWLWRQAGGEWRIAYGHVDHYPGLSKK